MGCPKSKSKRDNSYNRNNINSYNSNIDINSDNNSIDINSYKGIKFDNNFIYIPLRTINTFIYTKKAEGLFFCEYNQNNFISIKKIDITNYPISLSRFKYYNSDYLIISNNLKNDIYLIDDNGKELRKIDNLFNDCLDKNIQKLIVLDNKIIIACDNIYISTYKQENSIYKQYFHDINKNGRVLGLCKLSNNRFCCLSNSSYDGFIFKLFNEDYSLEIFELERIEKIYDNTLNHLFKISNDKVIVIGECEFIILNLKFGIEIETIFKVGLIFSTLPFNFNNIDDLDYYNYFAIIIYDNNNFYLKIFRIISGIIEETDKINLSEYSSNFEEIINDFKIDDKNNLFVLNNHDNDKETVLFEMAYDFNNKGKMLLIIYVLKSWKENKYIITLNIDLNKIQFY